MVKFSIYLNRRVFVMKMHVLHDLNSQATFFTNIATLLFPFKHFVNENIDPDQSTGCAGCSGNTLVILFL